MSFEFLSAIDPLWDSPSDPVAAPGPDLPPIPFLDGFEPGAVPPDSDVFAHYAGGVCAENQSRDWGPNRSEAPPRVEAPLPSTDPTRCDSQHIENCPPEGEEFHDLVPPLLLFIKDMLGLGERGPGLIPWPHPLMVPTREMERWSKPGPDA